MDLPHLSDDRLLDLASGLLSKAEADDAIAHCRECDECDRRLQAFVKDREATRARPQPQFKNGRFSIPTAHAQPHREPDRQPIYAVMVASLVIVFAVVFLLKPTPDIPYWTSSTFTPTVPRAEEGSTPRMTLDVVEAAYKARDGRATLAALDTLDLSKSTPATRAKAAVYRASALLNLKRPLEALDVLDLEMAGRFQSPVREEALWIVFLAQRELGDAKGMCETLSVLVDESGDKAKRARHELSQRSCSSGDPRSTDS